MGTRNNLVVTISQLTATNDALVIAVADNYRTGGMDGLTLVTEAAVAHIRALADLIDGLLGEANNYLDRAEMPPELTEISRPALG